MLQFYRNLSPGQIKNSYEFIYIHMNFVALNFATKLKPECENTNSYEFIWIDKNSYEF